MNLTRPLGFAFVSAAGLAALALPISCWPLGPSGADFDASGADASDAYVPPIGDAGPSSGDATTKTGEGGGATPEGGSSNPDASADGALDAAAAPDTYVPPPFPTATLATGLGFGCRIDATGAIWCWGDNAYGQTSAAIPPAVDDAGAQHVPIPNDAGALALALGDYHACALVAGGAVYCWGRDDAKQLNHAVASTIDEQCFTQGVSYPCNPTPLQATTGVASPTLLSASGAQTCAAAASGSIQCWGDAGPQTGSPDASLSGIAELSVAADHACVLTVVDAGVVTDGGDAAAAANAGNAALCWGSNVEDQITNTECNPQASPLCPLWSLAIPGPSAVAAGSGFTCAIPAQGGVTCFGDNSAGELGRAIGSSGENTYPDGAVFAPLNPSNPSANAVSGLSSVSALVASGNGQIVCALASGTVSCWGAGNPTPTAVTNLPTTMAALGSADGAYVCAQASSGGVWCWSVGGSATQVQ
jgi:hypothetical protein